MVAALVATTPSPESGVSLVKKFSPRSSKRNLRKKIRKLLHHVRFGPERLLFSLILSFSLFYSNVRRLLLSRDDRRGRGLESRKFKLKTGSEGGGGADSGGGRLWWWWKTVVVVEDCGGGGRLWWWWKTVVVVEDCGGGGRLWWWWKTVVVVEDSGGGGRLWWWWKTLVVVEDSGGGGRLWWWWKTLVVVEDSGGGGRLWWWWKTLPPSFFNYDVPPPSEPNGVW
ncbi:hypothetical protein H6P81_002524 [Aristolochia fimbriata]|uniref:Transmembrane protein n=1 Tax=Aristolochia fimbriata TaxID=158543 RepID=A0AAV7FB68_ARIFI|nr:hypothetical protein H6P81_002524 [Aristolochia fimbriata]